MSFYKKTPKKQALDPLDPIPVGETMEIDWSAWEESIAIQNNPPGDFQVTQHSPIVAADGSSDEPSRTEPR